MTPNQLAILNSLVTFAAENIPGGLAEDEREVAKIVGTAALMGKTTAVREYNYKLINTSYHKTIAETAHDVAERGWRVVAAISDTRPDYAHSLILERPVGMSHPND